MRIVHLSYSNCHQIKFQKRLHVLSVLFFFFSFCRYFIALSKDETENQHRNGGTVIVEHFDKSNPYPTNKILSYNGYSDEYLNRLESKRNIPSDKRIDRYCGT